MSKVALLFLGLVASAQTTARIDLFFNKATIIHSVPASSNLINCHGVSSGWYGITVDGYAVMCAGDERYRAELTIFKKY